MFVSWLELSAMAERAERDFAVPLAYNNSRDVGEQVFCWHPKTGHSLVITEDTAPAGVAYSLASAVADHASSFGVRVLRPDWEGTDPSPKDVAEWVSQMWLIYLDQRVPRPEPLVMLIPHYDKTVSAIAQGLCSRSIHDHPDQLVHGGPERNIYPVVSYATAVEAEDEDGSDTASPPVVTRTDIVDGNTLVMPRYPENRDHTGGALVFPARGPGSMFGRDMNLLPPDQIAQGVESR